MFREFALADNSDYEWRFYRHLFRHRSELIANRRLVAADALAVTVAVCVATVLAAGPHFGWTELQVLPRFVALSLIVMLPVMVVTGFYCRHARSSSLPDLTMLIPGTAIAVTGSLVIARGINWLPQIPLTTFPIMYLALLPMHGAARLSARRREIIRRRQRVRDNEIPVLMIGLGATGDLFLRAVQQGLSKYRVMGIIDSSVDSKDLLFHSVPILGSVRQPQPIIDRLMAGGPLPRCLLLTETITHFDSDGMAVLMAWAEAHDIKVKSLPNLTEPLSRDTAYPEIDPEEVLMRPQKTVERQLLFNTYCGQKVLVTGAGGSIGGELVRQLASLQPAELVLIENCELNAYQIDRLLARHFPQVPRRLHICCVRDAAHVNAIFQAHRPDLVFNAAALKHVPLVELNPCEGVLTNVIGTRNVCDAARAAGARAVVQVSTDKAVNTTNVMGATKRVGEFYCQAQDLITREIGCDTRFFTVRFGNVLGSSGSLIPLFQEQIARGGPLTVTDPQMERYFMTIREAVELTLLAAAQGLKDCHDNGRIFVLDMGTPVRIVDLAERMITMAGKVPGRDIRIEFIGIRPGEKLFEELFDRNERIVPTGFSGVSCAIPHPVPISRLRAAMLRLEKAARAGDDALVRAGLADLVPGYGRPADAAPTSDSTPVLAGAEA